MGAAEPNAQPFEQKGEVPNFPEELPGWGGYVEWEKYPEKKKKAAEILAQYDFPVVSVVSIPTMAQCCLTANSHPNSSSNHCRRRIRYWKVYDGNTIITRWARHSRISQRSLGNTY